MKITLHFLLALIYCTVYSQKNEKKDNYISSKNFNVVKNQIITSTLTGDKDLSSLSSFLSVNVVKPTITAALSIPWTQQINSSTSSEKPTKADRILKIWTITNINFTGGITDGTATLFKNEKYNTDITLQFEQSFALFTSFKYLDNYKTALKEKKAIIESLSLLEEKTVSNLFIKHDLLTKQIEKAKAKVNSCNGECIDEKIALNSLEIDQNKCLQEILKIDGKSEKDKVANIKLKKTKESDEAEMTAKWTTIKLLWAGPFYEYNHQKLNFYNTDQIYANQLTKETPENHKGGLRASFLYDQINNEDMKGNDFRHFNGLYTLSYSYSQTNNIAELTTENIITSDIIGSSEDQVRRLEKSVNAYNSLEYDDFHKHQITVDINKKVLSNFYFHIFYDINFIKDSNKYNGNYQNLGFGTVIAFKDKSDKEKKAFINLEPFVKFNDLGDKFSDGSDQFYKRATVGLRTTIPFSHLFQPKK